MGHRGYAVCMRGEFLGGEGGVVNGPSHNELALVLGAGSNQHCPIETDGGMS
jgi:hypothetical protein